MSLAKAADIVSLTLPDPNRGGGEEYPHLAEDSRNLSVRVSRGEGWVQFLADIDAAGNAVDLRVVRASGNSAQVRFVLEAAARWRWRPAMSDGTPVPGTALHLVRFSPREAIVGKADTAMARGFSAVVEAVEAGDRAAAEAQLQIMQAKSERNSAEYSLMKIGEALVQRRWGTPLEEFAALQDAMAGGGAAFAGLPAAYHRSAKMDEFRLLLALGRYADARLAGEAAIRLGPDAATVARLERALARVAAIENSAEPFRMQIQLGPTGLESVNLLRRQFVIVSGIESLSARLYCREGMLRLPAPLLAGTEFRIDDAATGCRLHLDGPPRGLVSIEEH